MTTDLEADLRREFDAVSLPSGLTFSPQSVLRQGSRTIRRNRIITAGSAAIAVALVATGANLLTRPHDTATPQPATHTATTGIVKVNMAVSSGGDFQFEVDRNPKLTSNLKLFVSFKDLRLELGTWSIGKPGQKPDAIWKSGIVDGHPYTVGLVPGLYWEVTLAKGASFGILGDAQRIPGYSMFAVDYQNGDGSDGKEPARPAEIASISWTGPDGVVDGIEGDHRLTGRVFTLDSSVSVKVALRPGHPGPTTVFGSARLRTASGGGYSFPLSATTTDPSGVAVVTGRQPIVERVSLKGQSVMSGTAGPPIAAGILPPGSSGIGWILTTGVAASPLVVSERLPDSSVIFAVQVQSAQESDYLKASVKAVTWTNADGSKGRKDVTQKPR